MFGSMCHKSSPIWSASKFRHCNRKRLTSNYGDIAVMRRIVDDQAALRFPPHQGGRCIDAPGRHPPVATRTASLILACGEIADLLDRDGGGWVIRRPQSQSTMARPSGLNYEDFALVRLIEFVPLPETARTCGIESVTGWVAEMSGTS